MKIGVLLDASGSMAADTLRTIDGFNEYIAGLKADDTTREAELTLAVFNSSLRVQLVHQNAVVEGLPALTQKEYRCDACTPLYDAIGQTIGVIGRAATVGEKVLFVITTDGMENCSTEYDKVAIQALIKEKEAAGWTFVFLGANLDAWDAQGQMGLGMAAGNTMSYASADSVATMGNLAAQTRAYAASPTLSTKRFWGGDPGAPLLTPNDVATAVGVSNSTLKTMRSQGKGPAYVRTGHKTVRYQRQDVADWLAASWKTTDIGRS